jgi:hypothetical protein
MSGPAYPPSNLPGANAIGTFAIGASSIGAIKPFDWWRTVISQYANSPILMQLIENFDDCVDQTANLEQFFDLIWNVDTAQGYGLDVWGRIVAVNRVLKIGVGPPYFGFDEGIDYQPFGTGGLGPFYSGQQTTENYLLSDPGFRVLILAKAFSNICDGSIKSINRLLITLFGSSGKGYVVDNLDMTMSYVFEFKLSPVQAAILTNSGVFPKPTGVSYNIVQL